MTFWQYFACSFCGVVSVFLVLLTWCCCVLAGRVDDALRDARKA